MTPSGDWAEVVADAIVAADVTVATIVPDSVTARVFSHLTPRVTSIAISREEEGVGVLGGAYLAGGFGVLLTQNTGLANAINAIGGYAVPAGIPMLLVVNLRGDLGEFSPAQVPLGRATEPMLRALGIPAYSIDEVSSAQRIVLGAARLARATHAPAAVLLRTSLHGGKSG